MATAKERQAAEEAKKFYELKQKVCKYYQSNGVPKKMEDVLNDMYYDNPADVYGYLSNFFASLSKAPSITKVKAREVLDSKGQPTLQTDIFCMVKNVEQLVQSSVVSSYGFVPEGAKPEEKDEEDKWRQETMSAAIELINVDLSEKLSGVNPTKLQEADRVVMELLDKLKSVEAERVAMEKAKEAAEGESPNKMEEDKAPKKAPPSPKKGQATRGRRSKTGKSPQTLIVPDEPREEFLKGSNSVAALSQGICLAGASLQNIAPYQHIAQIKTGEIVKKFKMPLPMVTLLQAGKGSTGKLRCVKDFMIVPNPTMSIKESVKHMTAIYASVGNSLLAKFGPKQSKNSKHGPPGVSLRNTNEVGGFCPPIERVEQGLDIIQEAISSLSLTPGSHFNIVLNCASHEIFDVEKGKYEISSGTLKGADDMVDFWQDIVHRYPVINGLIDPLRKRDTEQWNRLCEKISTKCYMIGDSVYHRPGLLKSEEVQKDLRSSSVVFRLEQMNTVSDIITCVQKMEESSNQIVLSTCQGETTDDFLADLAVGLGARFVKIGAPCRGERVSKLNRLLQIEDILESGESVEYHSEHVYPDLTAPPPEDIPEEGETPADGGEKDAAIVEQ